MIFGIPKELPMSKEMPECRVGLSPMGVKELVERKTRVYVESGAGEGAGFSNMDYEKAGASIVYSKEEAYKRADVVLKVRPPQETEEKYIKEEQTLMAFFHLVTAPKELIEILTTKKITVIGYEIIQEDDGRLPVVIPMSEIAGKLAVQIAGRLLESPTGGRGTLLGGIPGIPPAEVVILGGGTLGRNAAKSFAGIGANVYVVDINRDKLEDIAGHMERRVTTLFATKHNIEKLVKFADVIIGAVLVPGKRTPILVTKEMVKSMRKGAVVLDFSIDQGGCVETAKITPYGKFIYTVEGVIHFCMPNATTLVARTATHAMTGGIIPYLDCLVESGIDKALKECPGIKRGIYVDKGKLREEYVR